MLEQGPGDDDARGRRRSPRETPTRPGKRSGPSGCEEPPSPAFRRGVTALDRAAVPAVTAGDRAGGAPGVAEDPGLPDLVAKVHPAESAPMLVAVGTPSEQPNFHNVFVFGGW